MVVEFTIAGEDDLRGLAVDLAAMLEKLEDGEALATLFAFAALNEWVQPNDKSGRVRILPTGTSVDVFVTKGGRTRQATYDVSNFVDWGQHEASHSGYAEALIRLMRTVNEDLTGSALP